MDELRIKPGPKYFGEWRGGKLLGYEMYAVENCHFGPKVDEGLAAEYQSVWHKKFEYFGLVRSELDIHPRYGFVRRYSDERGIGSRVRILAEFGSRSTRSAGSPEIDYLECQAFPHSPPSRGGNPNLEVLAVVRDFFLLLLSQPFEDIYLLRFSPSRTEGAKDFLGQWGGTGEAFPSFFLSPSHQNPHAFCKHRKKKESKVMSTITNLSMKSTFPLASGASILNYICRFDMNW